MATDLVERLNAMYSHRGDGIPTQFVNPDGPEAAATIATLRAALVEAREALHQHYVDWDGEPEDAVPLQLARSRCDAALANTAIDLRDRG